MAREIAGMTALERRAAALDKGRSASRAERHEPSVEEEPVRLESPVKEKAGHPETSVEEEPELEETSEDEEGADDSPEIPEQEESAVPHATVPIERVNALLSEALRLGLQYHLVEKQPDGTFLLAGQTRTTRRESSDCTCQQCSPHAQMHWVCVVCHSGPHDWLMVKPQYERQALKPGGIEGTRHAACSAQCAREYMSTLGRQPSGVPMGRGLDPTLALP